MLPDLDLFMAHLRKQDLSRTTPRDYGLRLGQLDRWLRREGRTCDQEALPLYRDYLQTECGHAPATIKLAFQALRTYQRFRREVLQVDPATLPDPGQVNLPRIPKCRLPNFEDAEVDRVFAAVAGLPAHTALHRRYRLQAGAMMAVIFYAGCRKSDVLPLERRDVVQAGDEWVLRVRRSKGGEFREIELNAAAVQLLGAWFLEREVLLDGCENPALFPVGEDRRLGETGFYALWDHVMELAGLRGRRLTPHRGRHWFGSAAEEAVGIATASELLGHADISTTIRYLHSNATKRRKAVDTLARPLPPSLAPPVDPPTAAAAPPPVHPPAGVPPITRGAAVVTVFLHG
jgi:site-specific recombinase XerD